MVKRSSPSSAVPSHWSAVPSRWATISVVALVVSETVTRLGAPAALIVLTRGRSDAALITAAVVALVAAGRAWLAGIAYELWLRRLWAELVAATLGHSIFALRTRDQLHGPTALLDAAAQLAQLRASTLPRIVADAIGAVAVLVMVALLLGAGWVLAGIAALGATALVVALGQRRLKRAQTEAFAHFAEAARAFELLSDAALELRAHGREHHHASALLETVNRMSQAQRRLVGQSALLGLLPVTIALLVVAGPFGVGEALTALGPRAIEAAALGLAGLAFGVGLVRGLESWARTAPHRASWRRYLAAANETPIGGSRSVSLRDATIELFDVGVVYPGAARETPSGVSFRWQDDTPGLALSGDNGAGKSTLALACIGLLAPTHGRITVGEIDAGDIDWFEQRDRIVYVGQDNFVAGDRSIGWHLTFLAPEPPSDEEMLAALERVGLYEVLAARTRPGQPLLDTPAAQLSGGERKRMHLARAMIGAPDLVVLDEPEAGLDEASRAWLRDVVASLSETRRVLLIAHDARVIPPRFARITCRAREHSRAAESPRHDRAGLLAPPAGSRNTHRSGTPATASVDAQSLKG